MQRLIPARIYYGWVMVASALVINMATTVMNPVVFSFLIGPIAEDLSVTRGALSWALTLRLVAAGLTGPVLGTLIDRHGARWIGAACGLVSGTTMVALAGADSLWVVYGLFAISGLAGFGGPAGQLLTQVPLAKWFEAQRGRALAIGTMGLAGGTMVAAPAAAWLVTQSGWRTAAVIFGVVVIAVVIPVSVVFVRRLPEDLGLHPDGAPKPYAEMPPDANSERTARLVTARDWTVSEALRTPTMWLLLIALAISGVALTGTLVHRVDFWRSTGMAPNLVGFGTALDPFCVVFSSLGFGLLADRFAVRYLGFIGLAGLAGSMVPMMVSDGEAWTILAHNALWGIAAGGFITLNGVLWPNYFGRRHLGAIRGITLPVSIAASSLGAPLIGILLDAGIAPSRVWFGGFAAFAVSALMVLVARPPRAAGETPHGTSAVRAEAAG